MRFCLLHIALVWARPKANVMANAMPVYIDIYMQQRLIIKRLWIMRV